MDEGLPIAYDVLEAGVPQLILVYAAWLTPALLALAAVDPAPRWLALARRNVDTLHARLYDSTDAPTAHTTNSGYAHRAWRDGSAVRLDRARHTAAQAWMQYAQASLAQIEEPHRNLPVIIKEPLPASSLSLSFA